MAFQTAGRTLAKGHRANSGSCGGVAWSKLITQLRSRGGRKVRDLILAFGWKGNYPSDSGAPTPEARAYDLVMKNIAFDYTIINAITNFIYCCLIAIERSVVSRIS